MCRFMLLGVMAVMGFRTIGFMLLGVIEFRTIGFFVLGGIV